jgi:predicted PurR-regulated permease PerM
MSNTNRIFLTVVLALTLFGMYKLYAPFLMDIIIASLLAVAMNSINIFILRWVKYPLISAGLTTLVLLLLFFVPMGYAATMLTSSLLTLDITSIIDSLTTSLASLHLHLPDALDFIKPDIEEYLSTLDKSAIAAQIVQYASSAGRMSAGFVKDAALIVIFFFFAIYYGKTLSLYFKSVMPIDVVEANGLFFEVSNVMSVVFYSVILTAILEGFLFACVAGAYGYNAIMLGILYGFASLVPIIGGALVWVPTALMQFSSGDTTGAVVISIYSFLGIGIVDNFVKPLIIKYVNQWLVATRVYFNTLLIFFSIIAGLASFGFWGVILGPALTTFCISLLKLFRIIKEREKAAETK